MNKKKLYRPENISFMSKFPDVCIYTNDPNYYFQNEAIHGIFPTLQFLLRKVIPKIKIGPQTFLLNTTIEFLNLTAKVKTNGASYDTK